MKYIIYIGDKEVKKEELGNYEIKNERAKQILLRSAALQNKDRRKEA